MTWPLTQWHKHTIAPARAGHYLVRDRYGLICMMHWDGKWWRYLEGNAGVLGIEAGSMWAGLVFDPASARTQTRVSVDHGCDPDTGWWVPAP